MKQIALILHLQEETEKLIKRTTSFYEKDSHQLKQQKSANSWSALQCLEHLNRYSKFYLNEFELKIKNGKLVKKEIPFKSGFWGKLFINGMLPDEHIKKMKTFKSMNPSNNELNEEVLTQFIEDQKKLLNLLDQAKTIDLNKNNCSITLPLIRMRMGDTLMFYVYHNIRHLAQAEKALN